MRVPAAVLVVVLSLAGCAPVQTVQTDTLPRMGVDYAFASKHKCASGASPELRLANVPPGVTSFDVAMTDLDVPSFQHWRQTIPASGAVIREGAGKGYYGPCPPYGSHRYKIEVIAKDAGGKPVAYGEKTVVADRN
jgi:phosphatidylethanolamine-binding protein (PEBP) family uncharacterized protein